MDFQVNFRHISLRLAQIISAEMQRLAFAKGYRWAHEENQKVYLDGLRLGYLILFFKNSQITHGTHLDSKARIYDPVRDFDLIVEELTVTEKGFAFGAGRVVILTNGEMRFYTETKDVATWFGLTKEEAEQMIAWVRSFQKDKKIYGFKSREELVLVLNLLFGLGYTWSSGLQNFNFTFDTRQFLVISEPIKRVILAFTMGGYPPEKTSEPFNAETFINYFTKPKRFLIRDNWPEIFWENNHLVIGASQISAEQFEEIVSARAELMRKGN